MPFHRYLVMLVASLAFVAPQSALNKNDLQIRQWVQEQYGFVLAPAQRSTVRLCKKYQYKFKQIDCKKAVSAEVLRCMLSSPASKMEILDQYYYALL